MEYVEDKDVNVSYTLAPDDKLFYCPYNRSHQVRERIAASHLQTCRQAYNKNPVKPKDPIMRCQWAPNKHHVRKSMLVEHEKNCDQNRSHIMSQFNILMANRAQNIPAAEPDDWD